MTSILLENVSPTLSLPTGIISWSGNRPGVSLPTTNILPSAMILNSNNNNSTQTPNDNSKTIINSDTNDDDVTGDDEYPTICLIQ